MLSIIDLYKERAEQFAAEARQLRRRYDQWSLLRLLLFVLAVGLAIFLWSLSWIVGTAFVMLFIGVFYRFVRRHQRMQDAAHHAEQLSAINLAERAVVHDHQYQEFPTGQVYLDPEHPYALDLDLFGPHSFFQYICRAQTVIGQARLAEYLLSPAAPAEIADRQEAVIELGQMLDWRQHMQAYGSDTQDDPLHLKLLTQWLEDPPFVLGHRGLTAALYLIPLWTVLAIVLWIYLLPWQVMLLFLLPPVWIIRKTIERVTHTHQRTAHAADTLAQYADLLHQIEEQPFKTEYLQQLQAQLQQEDQPASRHIRRLAYIISQLNVRYNVFAIFLNIGGLWDLQWIYRLEKWKQKLRQSLPHWFEVLSELEALSSLGNLHYNQPDWAFAEWSSEEELQAVEIGHPLISQAQRVGNDLQMPTRGHIKLITGSNMAGKSTFLRTIGLNIVMAQAGSPVCAQHLRLPTLQVYTSMRTQDALHESTSSFYAELKRLKVIIEAVETAGQSAYTGPSVFFLLDEILKGTNSVDRHTGSAALIRQLIRQRGGGLIATHDLELGRLEAEAAGAIENLRIEVQIEDGQLHFDYKLKKGVSQSFNATLLMQRMGIRIEE